MIIQVSSSITNPVNVILSDGGSLSVLSAASSISASFSTTSSYAERTAFAHFAQMAESASYASIAGQTSFAVTASYADSASYAPTILPENLVSESVQIEHDLTAGYSASRHSDHASILMVAGDGLFGGGNILASRTFRIDTGSTHFINGVVGALGQSGGLTSSASAGAIYSTTEQDLLNQIKSTLIRYGLLT